MIASFQCNKIFNEISKKFEEVLKKIEQDLTLDISRDLQKDLINVHQEIKKEFRSQAECYDSEIFNKYSFEIENLVKEWNVKLVTKQTKKLIAKSEDKFFKKLDRIEIGNSLHGLSEKISDIQQKTVYELRNEILKYNMCVFDGKDIDSLLNVFLLEI